MPVKETRRLCLVVARGSHPREILHGALGHRGGLCRPSVYWSLLQLPDHLLCSHPALFPIILPELFSSLSGILQLPCHCFAPKSFPYRIHT